jgi:hypothetical protein
VEEIELQKETILKKEWMIMMMMLRVIVNEPSELIASQFKL